jgi:phosphoribosylformimino-5-aminoimidazole carboxamide ribotide isomerase
MLIVPAIDIIAGRVVRLEKGAFDKTTVYGPSPLEYAKKWEIEGAKLIHVVDLDGAKTGEPMNFDVIREIIKGCRTAVEVGGGIRNADTIKRYVDAGASRVVLSTTVMEDASFLLRPDVKEFSNKIAVSIDIKNIQSLEVITTGTSGWRSDADVLVDVPSFIRVVASSGVGYVNFSDISRDGMLVGPDMQKIAVFLRLVRKTTTKKLFFTYAGGVSELKDIKALKDLGDAGAEAVIIGKALYENKFTLKETISAAA